MNLLCQVPQDQAIYHSLAISIAKVEFVAFISFNLNSLFPWLRDPGPFHHTQYSHLSYTCFYIYADSMCNCKDHCSLYPQIHYAISSHFPINW